MKLTPDLLADLAGAAEIVVKASDNGAGAMWMQAAALNLQGIADRILVAVQVEKEAQAAQAGMEVAR